MIPFLQLFGKKEKPQYFLALLLRDEKVSAVIFEEFLGKMQVKGFSEEFFSDSLEKTSEDEWLEVLDKAISNAEGNLPPNLETQKTVFGLKENWIEQNSDTGVKIKKEFLMKLKKACESLGLEPLGFLVLHEAIMHLLKLEEGVPVSAILTEVNKENITVSIFRAGRMVETKRAKIEDSVAKTCDKLLHDFENCEILPSRIIIFDGKNVENLQQEFISHQWSKNLSFLHVPKTTILPKNFDAKAVLFGAAGQMGLEVLEEKSGKVKTVKEKEEILEEKITTAEEEKTDEKIEKEEKDNFEAESFGFIKGGDIALSIVKKPPKKQAEKEEEIIEKEKKGKEALESEIDSPKKINLPKIPADISWLKTFTDNLIHLPKKISLPAFSFPKTNNKIFIIPSILALFLIIIIGSYVFLVKSTIVLSINPKVVEQKKDVTFSTKSTSDFPKSIFSVETVSIEQEGQVSTDVTGKKEVGTPAKGSITIYSRLTSGKTFPKGTVVKTNDLKFTLDKDVSVSSGSADASSDPTTATVPVTASEIGKESNLPSGTKFSVGSFDAVDVIAKNDSAFSGGTKKEVTAVSKADLDKLSSELSKDLAEKAKNALIVKIGNEKEILPIFTEENLTEKEFSQKVGDEASTVGLKGTVSFVTIAYKKTDLEDFSKNISQEDIEDSNFEKSKVEFEIIDAKTKNKNEVLGKLNLKVFLMPKIDKKKLAEDLSGKSFDDARETLSNIPQVEDVEIELSPNLPFLPKLLPRLSKNIDLVVKSQN